MTASDTLNELLAAVLTAPSEDTPRLVYADALEDAGQVERAHMIRASIADPMGGTIISDPGPRNRTEANGDSETWRFTPTMHGYKFDLPACLGYGIRHGFIEVIKGSLGDLITFAPAIVKENPVGRVVVTEQKMWMEVGEGGNEYPISKHYSNDEVLAGLKRLADSLPPTSP